MLYIKRKSSFSKFPELIAQWHPTKNKGLNPTEFQKTSSTLVWWLCPICKYEWEQQIRTYVENPSCPKCRKINRLKDKKKSLGDRYPDLVKEWHPTKNGTLTPYQIGSSSKEKVWWQCSEGHEWESTPSTRRSGANCPICSKQNGAILRIKHPLTERPDLYKELHPNNQLPAEHLSLYSQKIVHWCCETCQHEWEASVISRAFSKNHERSCPKCLQQLAGQGDRIAEKILFYHKGEGSSLIETHPSLAAEWHPTRNGSKKPSDIIATYDKKVWWKCSKGHEWQRTVISRTGIRTKNKLSKKGCPECEKMSTPFVVNISSVTGTPFELEYDEVRNGRSSKEITATNKKIWWRCSQGHSWKATILKRLEGATCPICKKQEKEAKLPKIALLKNTNPELQNEWSNKNEIIFDEELIDSSKKRWWHCKKCQTEWQARTVDRSRSLGPRPKKSNCPHCNSLGILFPQLAAEWHPKNKTTPYQVRIFSNKPVWWRCSKGHEWENTPANRIGKSHENHKRSYIPGSQAHNGGLYAKPCPHPDCHPDWGWTVQNIRDFVASIIPYLSSFTAAEFQVIFDANGFSRSWRSKEIAFSILQGDLDKESLDSFIKGQPSSVDDLIPKSINEGIEDEADELEPELDRVKLPTPKEPKFVRDVVEPTAKILQNIETDAQAVEELIRLAVVKLWKVAFEDELQALEDARGYYGDNYAYRICQKFLLEYEAVKALPIPEGYSFKIDGRLIKPNLMQQFVAWKIQHNKRYGNWSGTGAGKTNSGILASRVIHAKLTLVTCPNNVVPMWEKAIKAMYPDSRVMTKTFTPLWPKGEGPCYLVINYEKFQSDEALGLIEKLVNQYKLDFVIVDEIQAAKQRYEVLMSKRRYAVGYLIREAGKCNLDLHVLGMSATPVINTLREGTSLIELITSQKLDWPVRANISNCVAMHREFTRFGVRWVPNYNLEYEEHKIDISCDYLLPEIRKLGCKSTPLELEQILTRVRLPIILQSLVPKTIIYTYNVTEVTGILERAIRLAGWSVGHFTGEDKEGLEGFLYGDVNVLIASSALSLGIDGLQSVCNRLIMNVLPWTSAEFDQLKGRIYRQGQRRKTEIIIPITYAEIDGGRWSWCDGKLARIRFKKTIGDAVADGVIPRQQLLTISQVYEKAITWLHRLDIQLKQG